MTPESEVVEAETTALVPSEPLHELPAKRDPYSGIATLVLSDEQATTLAEPIPPDDLDVKPDGSVFASQVRYRRILNRVFGPGRWALLPRGPWVKQENTICREYALIVDGKFVAESVGEQDYIPNNPNMSWATATEGAKSNALVRCCKDLGIASECWDRRFCEEFKAEHCVQVWVKQRDGKVKTQWRRKDGAKFWNEAGIVAAKPDAKPEEPPTNGEAHGAAPPPAEPKKAATPTRVAYANQAQREIIMVHAKQAGITPERLVQYLADAFDIEGLIQLPVTKLKEVGEWIEAQKAPA